jgi:hypothetical protein
MISSEFGRTPKINGTAGRDHWPKVFSVVLAGGGIKKGVVYGNSDATATEPEDDPLTVEDLSTTVYHCLGINADKELMAPGNRPIEICDGGKIVKELLAEKAWTGTNPSEGAPFASLCPRGSLCCGSGWHQGTSMKKVLLDLVHCREVFRASPSLGAYSRAARSAGPMRTSFSAAATSPMRKKLSSTIPASPSASWKSSTPDNSRSR